MGKAIIITEHHTESEIYNYLYSLHETFFDKRGGGLMKKYRRTILKAKGDKYLLLNDYEINNVTILLFGKMIKKSVLFGIVFVININGKLFSYELRNPKRDGVDDTLLSKYTPHFFSRYNKRENINKSGIELIKHFHTNNVKDVEIYKRLVYKDVEQIFVVFNQGVGLCKHFPITRGKIQIRSTYLSSDLLKSNQLMTTNEIIEIEKKEHKEELEYLKSKVREHHHSSMITV